jgi:hypothetical protein
LSSKVRALCPIPLPVPCRPHEIPLPGDIPKL